MFSSISVPKTTRDSKPRFTAEELSSAIEGLQSGPISDHVLYDTPKGKMDARTRAYYAGWYLRNSICETGEYTPKQMRVKTWADGAGYRWALTVR
jgi:hypothetical protein